MNTGTVESFNFNSGNGQHLDFQDQAVCVRRERGNCRICWFTQAADDFDTAGTSGESVISNGLTCFFEDHINIPGAKNTALTMFVKSVRCGRGAVTSICSTQAPFLFHFRSDAFEVTGATGSNQEAQQNDRGVRLTFVQDSTNC